MVTVGIRSDSLHRTTRNVPQLKKKSIQPTPLTNKQKKKPKAQREGLICLRSHSNEKNGDRNPGLLPASPHPCTASWREWDSAGNCLALEGRWANEWGRFIKKDSGHMSGKY